MHIPDGLIPFPQYIIYWILVLPLIYRSFKWAQNDMDEMKVPMFSILAAGIFAIQAVNLPLGVGASGHMVGAVLVSIIFASPYAGLLLLTLVLFVQAFVFVDGGVTALGANIFNMGVVSSWVGYYSYTAIKERLGVVKASFVGAWLGLFISALITTVEISFAGAFPLMEALVVMAIFHAIIGVIGEGLITAVVVQSIMYSRSDLIKTADDKNRARAISGKTTIAAILLVLIVAIAAPFVASSDPDGLEQTMIKLIGGGDSAVVEELLAENTDVTYSSPIADYSIEGLGTFGEVAAITGGTLLLLAIGLLVARMSKKTPVEQIKNAAQTETMVVSEPIVTENTLFSSRSENEILHSATNLNIIVEAKDLTHTYASGGTNALKGANFKVFKGERVALLGANGAGKSTLFKHLNGILKPTSGDILVKGVPITKKNIMDVRQTIGIVFQNSDDQIFAATVEQDVAFGPMNMGLPESEVKTRVKDALKLVEMSGFEDRAPHHLSGGQKKRIAIAGVLAMKPEVIVLDEPTAGLDPSSASKIMHLISKMNRSFGMTVILSTHDVDIVPMFAERVYVMHDGMIEAEGTPKEIFKNPALIKKAHLRLPRIARLLELLKEEGIDVEIAITPDDAKDELMRVIGQTKRS
ncbi:MAG: cobalt transporter CbiM [Methanosarcinaceae archaeon]|nr:cobalt transporter CbiM [Methanosarcinaceae archaeon]